MLSTSYPILNAECLFARESDGSISCVTPGLNGKTLGVPPPHWEVLRQCNGEFTLAELAARLSRHWYIDQRELVGMLERSRGLGILTVTSEKKRVEIQVAGDGMSLFPKNVSLELTDRCNLECTYCYAACGPTRGTFMGLDDALALLGRFRANGAYIVQFTGGEPLLHPEFRAIYEYAASTYGIVALLTNGVLVDQDLLDLIAKFRHKTIVQISIDGATEQTNALVRQRNNTFARSLDAIAGLVARGVKTAVGYVTTDENAHEICAAAKLANGLGVDHFTVAFADQLGRAAAFTGTDGKSLYRHMVDNYASEIFAVARAFPEMVRNGSKCDEITAKHIDRRNCGAGWRAVVVAPDGAMRPCPYWGRSEMILGNGITDDLRSVFNAGAVSRFCRSFSFSSLDEPDCDSCEFQGFCSSCLVHMTVANRHRVRSGKEPCRPYRDLRAQELIESREGTG